MQKWLCHQSMVINKELKHGEKMSGGSQSAYAQAWEFCTMRLGYTGVEKKKQKEKVTSCPSHVPLHAQR